MVAIPAPTPVGLLDDIIGHQGGAIALALNVAIDFGAVSVLTILRQNDAVFQDRAIDASALQKVRHSLFGQAVYTELVGEMDQHPGYVLGPATVAIGVQKRLDVIRHCHPVSHPFRQCAWS